MKENEKIKEFAIKKMLLTHLLKCEDDSNSYAITEFSIANFTRRVDIFFVKDDTLHAFEIKSEFDSLNRLEGQISEGRGLHRTSESFMLRKEDCAESRSMLIPE